MNNYKRQSALSQFLAKYKYKIYLAEESDVDFDNFPKAEGGKITASPLKTSGKFYSVEAETNSVQASVAAGSSARVGVLTLTAILASLTAETLAWVYENVGKRFIVVWEDCQTGVKYIAGSPCSGGLQLSYTNIGDNDGLAGVALQLQGSDCPDPMLVCEIENFASLVAA